MVLKRHSHLHQVPAPPLLPELRPGMDPTLLLLGQLCQGCACRLPALGQGGGTPTLGSDPGSASFKSIPPPTSLKRNSLTHGSFFTPAACGLKESVVTVGKPGLGGLEGKACLISDE